MVDTNLLLRIAQPAHPQSFVALRALQSTSSRGGTLYVFAQSHTEFWAVATRPIIANGLGMTPAQAESELSRLETLFPLLPDTPAVLPAWRRLVLGAAVSGKAVHDARLLAAAQVYGVGQLLTFNTADFVRYAQLAPGVRIVDPQAASS